MVVADAYSVSLQTALRAMMAVSARSVTNVRVENAFPQVLGIAEPTKSAMKW
jgi:hypothetical protein